MSGGDLPPRQKMIGMMYLVLTALLALNVSKDILDAFVLINNSLKNTVINYNEKNESLYSDFNQAKMFDPVKVTPYWEKAQKAKSFSSSLITYIKEMQTHLIQETEQIPKIEADTLQLKYASSKDNYDIPTHLMIGQPEDGSKGLGRKLKNKLLEFKKSMLSLFDKKDQENLKIDLKTDDIQTDEGTESWELGNFYHTPLAATITILSKIQTDIKNVEYDVVSNLLQSSGKKEFNFDTIVTKVIPNSNYVLLGEDYQADVFLAAFSRTKNPEILIGEYDSVNNKLTNISDTIPVKNGLGNYQIKTNKEGIFSYEGILKLKTISGGEKNFPFKSEYIVAKPSLVISPDQMNVFYIGPKNPVSISVPGVASENIKATISGVGNKINKISNGKYEVKLAGNSPRNVDINVSAIMNNGETKNMGKMTFVVKKLPKPYAEVGSISSNMGYEKPIQIKTHTQVKANYDPSFVFQGLKLDVVKYHIEAWRNGTQLFDYSRTGKIISINDRNMLGQLRKNDVVYFTKIFAQDVTGNRIPLNDVIIKIK